MAIPQSKIAHQKSKPFLVLALLAVGCASGPLARRDSIPPAQNLSAEQIIDHLNQNAQAIQSIECNRVAINVKQGDGFRAQSFGLNGNLAFQEPRKFRLQAHAAGSDQADMGSNEQEFWYWIKKDQPPALYHCTYADFPNCRNVRLPIHPDWIAEALGVTELGSPEQYRIRDQGKHIELVSQVTAPHGQPLTKVTTIARSTGRIVRHDLRSADGQTVWSAQIDEYQPARVAGKLAIPRRVILQSPQEKTELRLTLNGCEVNRLAARGADDLFRRPQMSNVPAIDLARGPNATPQAIRRVRGNE